MISEHQIWMILIVGGLIYAFSKSERQLDLRRKNKLKNPNK